MRLLAITALISLIAIFLFWFYNHTIEFADNKSEITDLKTTTEVQSNVIETKNYQQKLISNPTFSSDLAARDRWLQLLWSKSDKDN